MSRKTNTRDQLLDAAETVVVRSGAAHLTLDAVAAQAQVSKGGLLYHFPSKEALLQGMVERVLHKVEQDKHKLATDLDGSPQTALLAHIRAGFLKRPEQRQIAAALLAAGANEPHLLDPVRTWHAQNLQALAHPRANPSRVTAVMLALDGLWLNELLDISPLDPTERARLQAELEALAQSAG